jgi:hypothetical protein
MWHGGVMIGVAKRPIDLENPQARFDEHIESADQLQALTRETQAFAGQLYQELNHPTAHPVDRSWLCKRLC